ncbi:hypothetical protein GCM10009749_13530 [Agromyces neolithicus]|uniref:Uncharacterized protein n=1 Tax=Agromyces neolithicus TaxID=269420 RepID=A0ABP4YBR3_9MICO
MDRRRAGKSAFRVLYDDAGVPGGGVGGDRHDGSLLIVAPHPAERCRAGLQSDVEPLVDGNVGEGQLLAGRDGRAVDAEREFAGLMVSGVDDLGGRLGRRGLLARRGPHSTSSAAPPNGPPFCADVPVSRR